jgi:hypothetical protein
MFCSHTLSRFQLVLALDRIRSFYLSTGTVRSVLYSTKSLWFYRRTGIPARILKTTRELYDVSFITYCIYPSSLPLFLNKFKTLLRWRKHVSIDSATPRYPIGKSQQQTPLKLNRLLCILLKRPIFSYSTTYYINHTTIKQCTFEHRLGSPCCSWSYTYTTCTCSFEVKRLESETGSSYNSRPNRHKLTSSPKESSSCSARNYFIPLVFLAVSDDLDGYFETSKGCRYSTPALGPHHGFGIHPPKAPLEFGHEHLRNSRFHRAKQNTGHSNHRPKG